MSLLGKTIRLKGLSQKGKNRVKQHGIDWQVFAETDRVLFAPNAAGPWLYIVPVGALADSAAGRWVHANNDKDFEVIAAG